MANTEQQYYKHKYGGIYCKLKEAINKDNNDELMVVYEHVYPFDTKVYVRNKEDFYNSNKFQTNEQLNIELAKPRDEIQKEIMDKKNNK